MKKILFTCLIFFSCFAQAEVDEATSNNLADISVQVQSINENILDNIIPVLRSSLIDESYGWSIPRWLEDLRYDLSNFFYYDFGYDFYYYLERLNQYVVSSIEIVQEILTGGLKIELPEGWANAITPFLDSINVNIGGLAENFEGLNTSSEWTNTLLEDIREGINKIVGNTTPSNSPPLSSATIAYHLLDNFGINVDTTKALAGSITLTGEFNKDVHQLLIGLNQISSSENYALLSILTNVQYLVSQISSSADIAKVEQDISERQSEVGEAQQELYKIEEQNWDSFFSAPSFLSDVYDNLSINISSIQRPERIMIIDTFHFDSETFSCEISDVGFDLPNYVKDLVEYARTVFAFVYWTLTFFIALFFVRVWHRLFSYVLDCMIKP